MKHEAVNVEQLRDTRTPEGKDDGLKIEMVIPQERIDAWLKGAMENFPECAMCLSCTSWKYDKMIFKFEDAEDEDEEGNPKEYVVDLPALRRGIVAMLKYAEKCDKGSDIGRAVDSVLRDQFDPEGDSLGEWDAIGFDALVQCAIFGEVLYG
jgi:hypothetical protein